MVEIDFKKGEGLIPVIVQDDETGDVLMLAYMNREAWLKTIETGKTTYWSRSRNELWIKGETSGHVQIVKEIFVDCDNDTILLKVEQIGGAACHTGYRSCFYRKLVDGKAEIVGKIVFKPEDVYK
ncbi:MAG: phosphoribosyl-AMP cyclohydrolase [Syntrophaceae bacterium]